MGIREKISKEKAKVSGMNKEQKWEYFKVYYLAKTICVAIGIILLIWFVNDTILQKKVVSAGCVYSVFVSDDAKEALTTGYLEYYHYDLDKYEAFVSTDNMFEDTEQKMDANAQEMALITQASAGEIHYLILDRVFQRSVQQHFHHFSFDEAHLHNPLAEASMSQHFYHDTLLTGFQFRQTHISPIFSFFSDRKDNVLVTDTQIV